MLTGLITLVPVAVRAQTTTPPVVEAGFGRGVTIRSSDDAMSLNIRARIQVRGTASDNTEDDRPATTEAIIRRMRVVFQGNALGPRLTYYLQFAFSNPDTESDLRLPLRDAYVNWAASRDANIRVGQMKVPFARQRVVSSSALQFPDRSAIMSELNLDRDVGIQVFSKDLFGKGRFGYALGLFGGEGRNRQGRDAGALYTARFETWPLGAFDDFVEGDLRRGKTWRVAMGANVGYNQNTNRARSTHGDTFAVGDVDYTHASVDVMVKKNGCSVQAEWLYRTADVERQVVRVGGVSTTVVARSGWGTYAQGGCLVTPRLELSGRLGHLTATSEATSIADLEEFDAGVGYYLREHNLKVQTDYVYETGPSRKNHSLRSQLQLFF